MIIYYVYTVALLQGNRITTKGIPAIHDNCRDSFFNYMFTKLYAFFCDILTINMMYFV